MILNPFAKVIIHPGADSQNAFIICAQIPMQYRFMMRDSIAECAHEVQFARHHANPESLSRDSRIVREGKAKPRSPKARLEMLPDQIRPETEFKSRHHMRWVDGLPFSLEF